MKDQVIQFCKKYDNVKFSFVEQKQRLGLGHAINLGLDFIDEPVIIILGDSILELDYSKFISSKTSNLGVKRVPDPHRFGIAELVDGKVISLVEKPISPISDLALIGIYYIISQNSLKKGIEYIIDKNIQTNGEFQLTDAFSIMIKNNHQFSVFEIDLCLDCGIPETVFSTNKILLSRKKINSIDSSAIIEKSNLQHCTISKNCFVSHSNLNNVIMLPGSKVVNQTINDEIIGFNQILKP